MDETISNADIEEIKCVLKLYGILMKKEQAYLKEAFELQMVVDNLMYPKGIGYGEKIHSNNDAHTTPLINRKQHELKYADEQAAKCRNRYEELDRQYKIENRLEKISKAHRITIEMIFFQKRSYEQIADKEKIKKQSVSDRVKSAVISFIKVGHDDGR